MRVARPLALLVLLAALAGCSGTTGGQGLYLGAGTGSVTTTPGASSTAPASTSAPPTTAETSTTTPTTTSSPPPTTTSAPPPPTATSAAPTGPEGLTDDGWVVESFVYSGTVGLLFEADSRIRNDADTTRSAVYTFTLFDDETIVAMFLGNSIEVAPGDSVTATLISGDTFVEGEFSVDFQVDFSF